MSVRARSPRVTVALAIALGLAACPGDEQPGPADGGDGGVRPAVGGTLRVALASDVDSLDPHLAARPSSWWFARAIHRGLYAFPAEVFPEGAQPIPDLAEALPEVSGDGRTATVRLRSGVGFGPPASRPVRAADVAASLMRLRGAGVGIAGFLGVIEDVAAPNATTIRIRLSRATPELASLLAHPQAAIVPDDTPSPPARPTTLASAGPYRLASYEPERSIELERDPGWERDRDPVRGAWVDRIEASISGPAAAQDALLDGDVDLIVDAGPPDEPVPAPPEDARASTVASSCVRYLFLNPSVEPLRDVRIRRAIAHAVDREALASGDERVPAPRLLPPTVFGHATEPALEEDPARARALLARAGDRARRTVRLLVGDSERDRGDSAAVVEALQGVGMSVAVDTVPAASLYALHYLASNARTAMGIATWCADWPGLAGRAILEPLSDPQAVGMRPAPARPRVGASSARDALAVARRADGDDVVPAWAAADAALVRVATTIPLVWPAERVLLGEDLRGWVGSAMHPRGDPTSLWLAR